MLARRPRRRSNIKTTLGQYVVITVSHYRLYDETASAQPRMSVAPAMEYRETVT